MWQESGMAPAPIFVTSLHQPCKATRRPAAPAAPYQQQDVVKQLHHLGRRLQQRDDLAGGGAEAVEDCRKMSAMLGG